MTHAPAVATPAPARRVLVVGDVMTDIVVRLGGPLAKGTDTPATITQLPGGGGANVAAWLAHFGAAVTLFARVGATDVAAQSAALAASGVTHRLGTDTARQTGRLVALVDPDGERSFLTDRGANENLCDDDLPVAGLDGVSLLHVSGYALFAPGPRAAVLRLIGEAHARSIAVSIDPASASGLQDVGPQNFLDWITGATFCFPNRDEAHVLTGTQDRDAQVTALLRHCSTLAIKAGAQGAHAYSQGGARTIGCAIPGPAAVDTTGAGDAFLAAFLAAALLGKPLEASLVAGVRAGGQAVVRIGGRPPTRGAT